MDTIMIRHLRESVALLPMENSGPANEFYRRLFELAPEVRPMFDREIGLQAQKFSEMLAWVIANLDRPAELTSEVRALGARHGGYGVTTDQYAPIGSALMWMFQHTLGDRFTPEMEEAWLEFYAFLSFEMERGAREAVSTGAQAGESRRG
jgi:hemoglobin-like flavoprotein